ncbi:MAG TPA: DNA polymerase IV [Marmoricola sp.]|nr:DNA polymerase IV [Marmoricola sp.]
MDGKASILHADLDSFYASVEQRDDPALRGRPVLVGGGVVLAASYEAKRRGVRTPMNLREARLRCPDAIVVPPRMEAYSQASKAVFEVFRDTTPLVDALSIDEAFLEVGGLNRLVGSPELIGDRLRTRIREEVGLPITVGIARTKFLAKVASVSAKPDGLLLVPPEGELDFLHPLPVGRLWGVGAVTEAALNRRGLITVGDVAALDEAALTSMLGKGGGRHLHALAHNRDPRPVETGRRRKSIGAQSALGNRRRSTDEVEARLAGLVERVARRMRTANRRARTMTLRLRLADMSRLTRSHSWSVPTDRTDALVATARELFRRESELLAARGLTLIGISVSGFDGDSVQLELPLDRRPEALDSTLDDLRARFGAASVVRGSLVGRNTGFSVPLLPD